jgi:hypothetical protein
MSKKIKILRLGDAKRLTRGTDGVGQELITHRMTVG